MITIGSSSPFANRQERLAQAIRAAGFDALSLNAGPTLTYLTGLHFHLMERPVIITFIPGEVPLIVLPELESGKVGNLPYPLRSIMYGEDPSIWADSFQGALANTKLTSGSAIGVETTRMRVLELRLLEAALSGAKFIPADKTVALLRMIKDADEIMAMRKAVDIAQNALNATLPSIKIGISEKALAAELTLQLFRNGSDPDLPFSPIVSAGPNSANPHAVPTQRPLQNGDLLVIDWGASYEGYFSDLTRTFAVGDVDIEFARIAQIVLDANAAGRQAAGPEIAAADVDSAARAVIDQAGYGKYFTHRTGHGLGLEGHEEPYIRDSNPQTLVPGMTFTVEPGIYLPGRGGVRIEDDVVITPSGCESFSDLPRKLIRVD